MTLNTVLTGWHFMRWLRLGVGVFIGVQAIQMQDTFSGFIAVFFLFQAVTNTGCCGSSTCSVPTNHDKVDSTSEVEYEEITVKKSLTI